MMNRSSTDYVKSSTPIGVAITNGAGLYANDIMNARDYMEREYGSAITDVKLALGTFGSSDTLGLCDQEAGIVYLARKYASNRNMTEVMKNTNGFHPSIGDKTGAEAITSHELGHVLGYRASKKAGISEQQIVERAGKTLGVKGNKVAGHISEYARYNYSETIAEASADVYCNGKNASKYSTAVMNEIKKILK